MQFHLLQLLLLLSCQNLLAQQLTDARSMGASYSNVGSNQQTGVPLNIASLTNQNKSFAEATVFNRYSIKELTQFSIAYSHKLNSNNSLLAGIARSGNDVFGEQYIEAGISKKLTSKLSAGVLLQYYEWRITDSRYSVSHTLIPEIALLINALPKINFGVTIRNPVRSRMNASETHRLPAEINSGFSAKVSDKVVFSISALSATAKPASILSGIEYKYANEFTLRAGYNSNSGIQSFGCELSLKNYFASISIQNHPQLGISSSISLTFQL